MIDPGGDLASAYLFYAALFGYPGEEEWRFVRSAVPSMRESLARLGVATDSFDALAEELAAHDHDTVEPLYVRTFVNGVPSVEAPPFESLHVPETRRLEVLASVAEHYQRCGVALADDVREMPDHIAVELELMVHLCRERTAHPGAASTIDDAMRTFITEHLLPFVRSLGDGLGVGIYRRACRALEALTVSLAHELHLRHTDTDVHG
jgi:TorA maturation chaperone TorD